MRYEYKGGKCTLADLYHREKQQLIKDAATGLQLRKIIVTVPGSRERAAIVFTKGYEEPKENEIKGKNKQKKSEMVGLSLHRYCPVRL